MKEHSSRGLRATCNGAPWTGTNLLRYCCVRPVVAGDSEYHGLNVGQDIRLNMIKSSKVGCGIISDALCM
eukprot:358996-Chlamydomonas_euryale.AAC.7